MLHRTTRSNLYEDEEVQKELTRETVSLMSTTVEIIADGNLLRTILDEESQLYPAKTLMGTLKRCFRVWKHEALKIIGPPEDVDAALSVLELQESETHLIKLSQEEAFPAILSSMKKGLSFNESVAKLPSDVRQSWMREVNKLIPFVDADSVLRVGGRLQQSDFPFHQKHPALLPRRCDVTKMMVRNAHHKIGHGGDHATLSVLRTGMGI